MGKYHKADNYLELFYYNNKLLKNKNILCIISINILLIKALHLHLELKNLVTNLLRIISIKPE